MKKKSSVVSPWKLAHPEYPETLPPLVLQLPGMIKDALGVSFLSASFRLRDLCAT